MQLRGSGVTGTFQLFPPSVNSCIMALGIVCPQLLSSSQAEKRSPSSSECVLILADSVCSAVMYTLLSYSVTDLEKMEIIHPAVPHTHTHT